MRARDKITGPTVREEAFCVELVRSADGNLSDAHRNVYSVANMKKESVAGSAHKVMRRPRVAARVAELRANAAAKHELSIEQVLAEACCLAFVNPRSLLDGDGKLLPLEAIPDRTWRAVASLRFQADGGVAIRFWDKGAAIDRLMRFLGLFEKDNRQ